jgi:hypothetical protein
VREIHVAGRIFQPGDALAEGTDEAADERDMPRHSRLGREMIEVDRDRLRCGRADDRLDHGEQSVVGYALIIKGRQYKRASKADPGRVAGQRDRVVERGGARSDQHAVERQAAFSIGPHHPHALQQRERSPLAGGAEYIEPVAAVVEKKARERDRAAPSGSPVSSIAVAMAAITP